MGLLNIVEVTKIHGEPGSPGAVTALEKVSLKVENNQFCAVLGKSGGDKATLLSMVAGFEQPTYGEISIDSRRITRPGWRNTSAALVRSVFPGHRLRQ
jgi:ABC-type Fe3+/spermidine/putrescine transport system ATPase subunit